jgi:hypothetical protein
LVDGLTLVAEEMRAQKRVAKRGSSGKGGKGSKRHKK